MSVALDPSLQGLNDCGGCAGIQASTPILIANAPGLNAIVRRVGVYGTFKESMLASLSSPSTLQMLALQSEILGLLSPPPSVDYWPLSALQTRQDTDFTIALLDSWSCIADILTFYQERLSNEAYLRTSVQSVSLRLLARLVGYELRPGVAASTNLAFMLENSDINGQPYQIPLAIGTQVQSIPAPGQTAQTYETVQPITARSDWNAITPSQTLPLPSLDPAPSSLWAAGIATGLKPGDFLLLAASDSTNTLVTIAQITPDPVNQNTRLDLVPVQPPSSGTGAKFIGGTFKEEPIEKFVDEASFAKDFTEDFTNSSEFITGSVGSSDLQAYSIMNGLEFDESGAILAILNAQPAPPPPGVYLFKVRASAYGNNAPLYASLPTSLTGTGNAFPTNWDSTPWTFQDYLKQAKDPGDNVYLDSLYSTIVPPSAALGASLMVLLEAGAYSVENIVATDVATRADMMVSSRVSKITLSSSSDLGSFHLRNATVLAASQILPLVPQPDTSVITGTSVILAAMSSTLQAGQTVIVTGMQAGPVADGSTVTAATGTASGMTLWITDSSGNSSQLAAPSGQTLSESVVLEEVTTDFSQSPPVTTLAFAGSGLQNSYVRSTVTINANVAPATHGQTTNETLGSGDATTPFLNFTLRQPPLTFVSSASSVNGTGTQSTLTISVNNLLWNEVPYFYGHGPNERIFVTRQNDDGTTTAYFGDGTSGARTPTGQQNITSVYRRGIGLAGNVGAGQISLLLTRPQGLKGVTNPEDATGGQDPDPIALARQNAPIMVRTLSRVVSLEDYQDFAMAFGGIGKALATPFWNGRKRGVFLTLAGPNGDPILTDSSVFTDLVSAIGLSGDPNVPLIAASYQSLLFRISANLVLDTSYDPTLTQQAVTTALQTAFSFQQQAFGQPVYASEVLQLIQQVPGVIAAILTSLATVDLNGGSSQAAGSFGAAVPDSLPALLPQINTAQLPQFTTAQLLTLDPSSPTLEVVS